jgi:sarcosine oxidase subunit beta
MTSSAPAVGIIGAGAIGLATAVHLQRRGVTDVFALDADYPASGSSGLSVGIIETQYIDPLDIELRARSIGFFKELHRDHGLHLMINGYLRLAHDDEAMQRFERSVELQHDLGIRSARTLSQREVSQLIPDLQCDDVAGGLYGPEDGFIDGHLYCGLLSQMVVAGGGRVMARERLREAELTSTGRHVLSTDRGRHECDLVVNAAGPWASVVGEILNAPLTVLPQRHQAVVVHLPRPLAYTMPSVMDYTPGSGRSGLYFRHERAKQLIAGVHTEEAIEDVEDPDSYARSADHEFLEEVAELFAARLPSLEDARLAHGWAGLYPMSPDGLVQVGPSPTHDTVIATAGAGGSGIQLSPIIGRLAAEWIVDGRPSAISDADALSPNRSSIAIGR